MPTPTLPIRSTITVADSSHRVDELVRLHRTAADALRALTRALDEAVVEVPYEHLVPMLLDDPRNEDITADALAVLASRAGDRLAELRDVL